MLTNILLVACLIALVVLIRRNGKNANKPLLTTDQYNDMILFIDRFWHEIEKCSVYQADGVNDRGDVKDQKSGKTKKNVVLPRGRYLKAGQTPKAAWNARQYMTARLQKHLLNKQPNERFDDC